MQRNSDLVSPKQVARAIGVSESSLKRWCDQGLIQTVRTVGGHRKMPTADVLRFVRERGHPLVLPELLGLPAVSDRAPLGLERGKTQLIDALLAGDEPLARQIFFDLYLAKHALSVIFDEVIAEVFREIGQRWVCQEADVYQERRGCEVTLRLLFEVRKMQKSPDRRWIAMGGSMEGDLYALPSAMAELVLREVGFQATSLGNSIPFASLIKAVEKTRPHLFWLSVSFLRTGLDFVNEFGELARACTDTGTALVVGGRALTEELRHQITYSAYCDTMQHLEAFARTLLRSLRAGEKGDAQAAPTPRKPPKRSSQE